MQDTYQLLLAAFVVGFLLHRSVSAGNHPSLIRQANRKSRRTDLSQSAGSTGSRVVLLPQLKRPPGGRKGQPGGAPGVCVVEDRTPSCSGKINHLVGRTTHVPLRSRSNDSVADFHCLSTLVRPLGCLERSKVLPPVMGYRRSMVPALWRAGRPSEVDCLLGIQDNDPRPL